MPLKASEKRKSARRTKENQNNEVMAELETEHSQLKRTTATAKAFNLLISNWVRLN